VQLTRRRQAPKPRQRKSDRRDMAYVNDNLISGERVTYRGRLHWLVLLWPITVAVGFAGLGLFIILKANETEANVRLFLQLGAAVMIIGGVIPLISALIRRSSAEYAVTNKRIILKEGTVRRRTAEMFLTKVESVGVDQTLGGRVFDYGSIILRGTGGSSEPFHLIAQPLEFRRQVQEQISRLNDLEGAAGTSSQQRETFSD
jgi:uncharacterized membrane protein YdbT with pleckstrin-like domain